jgi:hypothetical protein
MGQSTMLWLIAAAGLSLPILGQEPAAVAPIPSDPLELVTAHVQPAATAENRQAALELLSRARKNYALRTAGHGYDLKATFTVNSGGQTQFDGAWQIEDRFDPAHGLRWTATAAGGYTITQISSKGKSYMETTGSYIPLRLQEARAALFDPIPSAAALVHAVIRTSAATFHSTAVTCVLLSGSENAGAGRRWDETEECIDPQSGLLMVHSQVPGRYFAYNYSNAPQLDGHTMPRKVIVTEAGKPVSEISIESLTELPAPDPSLFVPTPEMKERGSAIAMGGAQKIGQVFPANSSAPAAAPHTVCVFGLVTPSGELVEAHSLQPSDPYSQTALANAKQMNFVPPPVPGRLRPPLRQHFVFIVEQFGSFQ